MWKVRSVLYGDQGSGARTYTGCQVLKSAEITRYKRPSVKTSYKFLFQQVLRPRSYEFSYGELA